MTDTLKLCLPCFISMPKSSYPPIRSVPLVTSINTIHLNLEVNNVWLPRMVGRVSFLSVTGWPTYLSDALPMNIWSHIPSCPLPQLESGIHRIYMTTANGVTLTTMQALVPTFLIPVIPNQMIFSILSYQLQNTRPPDSPFREMWTSPRMLLRMNYSLIYRNLTPANLTILMASLHIPQSDPLASTTFILPHIT